MTAQNVADDPAPDMVESNHDLGAVVRLDDETEKAMEVSEKIR